MDLVYIKFHGQKILFENLQKEHTLSTLEKKTLYIRLSLSLWILIQKILFYYVVYLWVWMALALHSLWDIGIIIRMNSYSYCYCPCLERGPTHLGGCPGRGRKPVVHSWGHPTGYAWGLFSYGKKSRGETKFIMPMTKKVRAVMFYKRISEKISLACFRSVELAYEIFRLCKWTQLF